jgi:hypothetical protein
MPPDIKPRPFLQGWGHGPVYLDPGMAWCAGCVWVGPDRAGDPHAVELVEDDACHHLHTVGADCVCEACVPGGALL